MEKSKKILIVGAGRTLLSAVTSKAKSSDDVVLIETKTEPTITQIPKLNDNIIVYTDSDRKPTKKRGSNFTPKKKKRKK